MPDVVHGGDKETFPNPDATSSDVRGIRNNNPGNLRLTGIEWKGKIPNSENTDGEFEQFETMELGARAQLVNLRTYMRRGIDTVREIITRYAPHHENPTESYIDTVSKNLGVDENDQLKPTKDTLISLGIQLAKFETGNHPDVNKSLYEQAFNLM